LKSQSYSVSLWENDRYEFDGLIQSALKAGGAAAPVWGRPQRLPDATIQDSAAASGQWSWSIGDWAFFSLESKFGRNRLFLVNCGGSASGLFIADSFYTYGIQVATASAINRTLITGFDAPPESVYKSARNRSSASASSIVYLITGLDPTTKCRIRLHFAEIESGFDRSQFMRLFDIYIAGASANLFLEIEPFAEAGYVANKAISRDVSVYPNQGGSIQITFASKVRSVVAVAESDVDLDNSVASIGGTVIREGDAALLNGQTDPSENGIWIMNNSVEELHYRALWADSGDSIKGIVVKCGETFYRNTNAAEIELGTTAITFDVETGDCYHCGINAIELYQYYWEVKQLTGVSGALSWSGWLKGDYRNGIVYPMILGRLKASGIQGITDRLQSASISISEPAAVGRLGIPGQCSTEICDGPFPPEIDIPFNEEAPVIPGYSVDPVLTMYCFSTTDPEQYARDLTSDKIEHQQALLVHQVSEYIATLESAGATEIEALNEFWSSDSTTGNWFDANVKYASGSTTPNDGIGDSFVYGMSNPLCLAKWVKFKLSV
jgi:hypothetical protein